LKPGSDAYGATCRTCCDGAADIVDKILRGTKPGEIPPLSSRQDFDLVINIKTAKALELEIPDKLMALASR
jgi:putative ABC transport system substrate-binding protein